MNFVEGASEIGEFNFVAKEMELDLDRYLNITLDWESIRLSPRDGFRDGWVCWVGWLVFC